MSAASVLTRAHAKLNLALRVYEREASGYHQIETVFCALELCDDIELTRIESGIELDVRGEHNAPPPDLGPPAANLAWRAAALFLEAIRPGHGVHIALTKRIPAGTGLGGGSSDAAAVLDALNRMQPQPREPRELMPLAARLGSDVPFFMSGAPLAFGWGRGEHIAPLEPLPSRPVVLVVPPERISTADAYAMLDDARSRTHSSPADAVLRDAQPRTWQDIAAIAHNDFEEVVFARHPRLAAIRDTMDAAHAMTARMTGSGSVVFGIFTDDDSAAAAAGRIARDHAGIDVLTTCTR